MKKGREIGRSRNRSDLYRKTQTNIYEGYDTDYDASRRMPQEEQESSCIDAKKKSEKEKIRGKRKKRRKKHYLLRLLGIIVVVLLLYFFLTSSVFSIDKIVVEGNTLLTDDEIIALSGVEIGDNMFQQTEHRVWKSMKKNPYLSEVDISRKLPNIYTISETEHLPMLAVQKGSKYIVMDEEGAVLEGADSQMHATLVKGLKISKYKVGKVPEFEDSVRFQEVMDLIRTVNASGMYFKKLELEQSLNIKGYVTDTLIISGFSDDIAGQLENIKAVLYDLDQKEIRRGIVTVGADDYISFSPVTE